MKTTKTTFPDRYLSTNLDPNGVRQWRVIGFGGMPECRDTDLDDALVTFLARSPKTPQADVPVWNGDADSSKSVWTTLATFLPAPAAKEGDNA